MMKQNKVRSKQVIALQEQAEKLLEQGPEAISKMLPENLHDLVQQLHDNQHNLEIQNKKIQKALREREKELQILTETSIRGIVIFQDNKVRFINKTMSEMLGYSVDELKSFSLEEAMLLIHPDDQDGLYQRIKNSLGGKSFSESYQFRINRKDGASRWFESSVNKIVYQGKPALQVIFVDVTARKTAENALKRRLEFERLISTISADFINLPVEEIDDGINKALEIFTQFANAVCSSVFIFSDDCTTITDTYEWCSDPKYSQVKQFQDISPQSFTYYWGLLQQEKPVVVTCLDDLPTEASTEREWIKKTGFRPLLFVPKFHDGKLYGIVGFYGNVDEERDWSQELILLLKLVAEIIVNALERKRVEETLRDNENRFRGLFNYISSGVVIYEAKDNGNDFIFKDFNPAGERIEKTSRKDVIGKSVTEVFPGVMSFGLFDVFKRVWKTGKSEYHPVNQYKDQRIIGWRENFVFKLPSGEIVAVYDDITERKQVEEALQESEERYRTVADFTYNWECWINPDGHYLYISPSCERITGYSVEEFLNTPDLLLAITHSDDQEIITSHICTKLPDDETGEMEFRIITRSGQERWINHRCQPVWSSDGRNLGRRASNQDITERKQAEEKLRRLATIVRDSNDAITVQDFEGRILTWNQAASEMYGWSETEVLGKNVNAIIPEEKQAEALELVEILARGEAVTSIETQRLTKDGSILEVWLTASVLLDDSGRVRAVVTTERNITERKQAEMALRESEKRFQELFNSVQEGIGIVDENEVIQFCNPAWAGILDADSPDKIVGRDLFEFVPEDKKDFILSQTEIRKTNESSQYELEFITLKNNRKNVIVSVSPRFDKNDDFIGAFGAIIDITERKQMEQTLRESEEGLQDLFNSVLEGIGVVDENEIIQFCNPAYASIFEVDSVDDLVGKNLLDYISEGKRDLVLSQTEIRKTNKNSQYELEIITAKNNHKTIFVSISPRFDENNNYIGAFGSVIDITERKRVEDALRVQRDLGIALGSTSGLIETLDKLLDAAFQIEGVDSGGVYLVDSLTGDLDLVIHKGLSSRFIANASHYDADSPQTHLVMAGKPVYTRHSELERMVANARKPEGLRALAVIPVQHKGRVVAALNLASHTIDDVTTYVRNSLESIAAQIGSVISRIRTEDALRINEERFRQFTTVVTDVIYRYDPNNNRYDFISPSFEQQTGYTLKELEVDPAGITRKIVHQDDVDRVRREVKDHLKKGPSGGTFRTEYRVIRKNRLIIWVNESKNFEFTPDGKLSRINGVIRDVTHRKIAEQQLQASEANYRAIFDGANDAIFVHDIETGEILDVNGKTCEMFGYTPSEIQQIDVGTLSVNVSPYTQKDALRLIKKAATGKPQVYEWLSKDKSGRTFWVEVNLKCITIGNKKCLLAVVRDITDRKRIEEELTRADKLESLGVLAGGIAHDFNNILTAILGNVSMAKTDIDSGSDVYQTLADAEKATERAQGLTQQLLTFSRGGAPIMKTASIIELIEDSASFALRGSNVRCEHSLPEELYAVEIDEGQISRVISNLVINAVQAMLDGGTMIIQAKNITMEQDNLLSMNPGKYVKVSIEDHGVGIPEEHLQVIFDPFFTTKAEGSGLGLATCYSIIKKHDGKIFVESQLGKGTTFYIYLPASDKEILSKSEPEAEPVGGSERILIVDDEEMVRRIANITLTKLGYEVHLATDGSEAVTLYEKHRKTSQPFDAVILDLTIPGGMDGKTTIRKLRKINPQVKAIVTSGYSNDPVMADFEDYGFVGCLVKPYTSHRLGNVLHKVLTDKK